VGLAKLGDAVRFAGLVGQDQWGDFSLQALVNAGIDTSGVRRDASVKTGITISITSAADRAFVTHLGAIAAFRAAHLDRAVMDGCGHLHISSYFLQEGLRGDCRALFAEAHRRGMTTSLDPGFDPTEKWDSGLRDTLTEVDVFFPNEVELRGAGGSDEPIECLRRLDNGRTLVMAKLGREGCMALDGDSAVHVPAFAVEAVDTTGAGDSFNAGFLHAWLGRRPLKEAMRFAAACGALSTRAMGGTGSQATESEAEEMLNGTTGN
jgi:sugar/nucleoside kinase (ribokinase family)